MWSANTAALTVKKGEDASGIELEENIVAKADAGKRSYYSFTPDQAGYDAFEEPTGNNVYARIVYNRSELNSISGYLYRLTAGTTYEVLVDAEKGDLYFNKRAARSLPPL